MNLKNAHKTNELISIRIVNPENYFSKERFSKYFFDFFSKMIELNVKYIYK
jgi:hypothetical protein